MNALYERFSLTDDQKKNVTRLIDRKEKMSADEFLKLLTEQIGGQAQELADNISSPEALLETLGDTDAGQNIVALLARLAAAGFDNARFTPTITRGFDYYTGMVFEIFDTDPVNPRAVAGGGRYDELLDVFGVRTVPTAGFGMGDVVLADFLAVRNLIPEYRSTANIYLAVFSAEFMPHAQALADILRSHNVNVALDLSGKKIGDQIKIADKQKIPYIVVIGENEAASAIYTLKQLSTGTEKKLSAHEIAEELLK